MGFNFPNSPTPGQVFVAPSGPQYVFSEGVWRVADSLAKLATARERNRIVNGAMQLSQEVGIDVATSTSGSHLADQWKTGFATSGAPAFICMSNNALPNLKALRANSGNTIDAAVAAADYVALNQAVEGIRISDFLWGTANAKPAVLRFSARGFGTVPTIGVTVRQVSGTHTFVKNIALTNVWQDFVIPLPAQPNGVWDTGAVSALLLGFTGMAGTTYTTGAVDGVWNAGNFLAAPGVSNMMATVQTGFDITNIGLYLDPDNTGLPPPWEEPDLAEELRACQRYYQVVYDPDSGMRWSGQAGGTYSGQAFPLPTQMRTAPAVSTTGRLFTNATYADQNASPYNYYVRLTPGAIGGYRCYSGQNIFNARM